MASGNMKDIKRRIKSVESTMQITKAMELVASSKLRKAKEKADKARPYFDALYETMCEIQAENPSFLSPFTRKVGEGKSLLVVIAGDRGLAEPSVVRKICACGDSRRFEHNRFYRI